MPTSHHNAEFYCAVPDCRNRSTLPGLHFHRFPVNPNRRKKWLVAIRRDVGSNFQVTGHTRVCSPHFLPSDYCYTLYATRLAATSVPSVFAWSKPVKTRRAIVRRELPTSTRKSSTSTSTSTSAVEKEEASAPPSNESPSYNTPPASLDHDYTLPLRVSRSYEESAARIAALEESVGFLRTRSISLASLTEARKDEFKTYTGLPNKAVFYALARYLQRKARRLKWWRGLSTLKHEGPV